MVQVTDEVWIWHCCGCGVGQWLKLQFDPWPGNLHMLGVELELQLLAYTRVTAMPDPSHACDLHHSSWQPQILNPLSEAGDQTHNLMVPSWICFCWATMGTPRVVLKILFFFLFFFFLAVSTTWGSSWARDQTSSTAVTAGSLSHCATRKVLNVALFLLTS